MELSIIFERAFSHFLKNKGASANPLSPAAFSVPTVNGNWYNSSEKNQKYSYMLDICLVLKCLCLRMIHLYPVQPKKILPGGHQKQILSQEHFFSTLEEELFMNTKRKYFKDNLLIMSKDLNNLEKRYAI